MNKEDLRTYRAWHFCESVLGPSLTNELKQGRSIYIAAKNGEVYELGPRGNVGSVTRNCTFCVHMESTFGDNDYPFPDCIVHRFDWITKDPDGFNKEAHVEKPDLNSTAGRNMILTGSRYGRPRRINLNRMRNIMQHNVPLGREEFAQYILWAQNIGEDFGQRIGMLIDNVANRNRRQAI